MAEDPEARARGRIGAFALHSQRDGREVTARAREAFLEKFRQQVDPESKLDEDERHRRAQAALKEHMHRLALRSAQKRRAR